MVEHALPLALANPLVLMAAYMTVVTRHRVPDADTLQRVMARAFDSVPGARDGTRAVVAACSDTIESRDATRIAA